MSQPEAKFRFFLARKDGKPGGTAGYILRPDCAYFVSGSVLPAFRGQGLYRALIVATGWV